MLVPHVISLFSLVVVFRVDNAGPPVPKRIGPLSKGGKRHLICVQ